jgi:hypothetical protein
MARKFIQGKFTPKNPLKYVGDVNNIIYRSGWEKFFLNWCDNNHQVVKYASEELIIPYTSPIDYRTHRYFPDFMMIVQPNTGPSKKVLVEIKPHKERFPPTGKRKTKALNEAVMTYHVNQAKWAAAEKWCTKNGFVFMVLDEYDLGIATRKKK